MGREREGEVRGREGRDGLGQEAGEGLARARRQAAGCVGEVGLEARREGEGAQRQGRVGEEEEEVRGGVLGCCVSFLQGLGGGRLGGGCGGVWLWWVGGGCTVPVGGSDGGADAPFLSTPFRRARASCSRCSSSCTSRSASETPFSLKSSVPFMFETPWDGPCPMLTGQYDVQKEGRHQEVPRFPRVINL